MKPNGHDTPIAIVSDATLFREGLHELLRSHGFDDVVEYESGAALITGARARSPRLVLIDLDHERDDVTTLVRHLRRALVEAQIVAIGSVLRQAPLADAVDAALETPESDTAALLAATHFAGPRRPRSVEAARQRKLWNTITPRQRDVLRWLATGANNRTIARKLRIGERATKLHVSSLLEAFGLGNRAQLALLAYNAGFRPPARARA
jgi:DNA-binding NarL/FixJ family response regulator